MSSSAADGAAGRRVVDADPGELEQMRLALELGLRDYVDKNGFSEVVLGVSGGIDSALTAALAAEALGPERVHCVSMPSRYSSEGTRGDARRLAENLGCDFRELPIEPIVDAFDQALAEPFAGREPDLTEENLQARVRGVLLMALSNKFGWLLLATGNKSELSVGYATLYGDMAGGFALLKDVYKTDVFRLARHLNERAGRELIPASIIERAPSAELRADQLDEDSLPPYPELDPVLEAYVELDRSREELSAGRVRPGRRRARARAHRPRRVQAPPGAARREAAARRRSAATGARRSRTAGATSARRLSARRRVTRDSFAGRSRRRRRAIGRVRRSATGRAAAIRRHRAMDRIVLSCTTAADAPRRRRRAVGRPTRRALDSPRA